MASGGIASAALSRSLDMRLATDLLPVGLVGDEQGRPLNVADFALEPVSPAERPLTVAVIGTSMNSGKTTTIHFMVHGLSRAGVRAGVTKVTGTGSGGDYWVMLDAGAHRMLDFTDAGWPRPTGSRYRGSRRRSSSWSTTSATPARTSTSSRSPTASTSGRRRG